MSDAAASDDLRRRKAPLEMDAETFRRLGRRLVDEIAGFLEGLPDRPVTPDVTPTELRSRLPQGGMPREGRSADELLEEVVPLLVDHSLFNGHPRFMGYVTSSAAPIGALAEMLAATVNANLGGWQLSPMATELEEQSVRWIADLLGYPCGAGLLVSGGNVANFHGFLAARRARGGKELRSRGLGVAGGRLVVYASEETHTWIEKATDLFGHGTGAIRYVTVDRELRLDVEALRRRIAVDRRAGDLPFLVVGNAGTVSTGAVDPLAELAALAREEELWFHVDGCYGAFAVLADDVPADLDALREANSIAVDPHKWLYAPLEAGCLLTRHAGALRDTFDYTPRYYSFAGEEEDPRTNFYAVGMQNSRGFRGLKVWLSLRQAGRDGYARMIGDDMRLARELYQRVDAAPELEAFTCGLGIATFRYVPEGQTPGTEESDAYLNRLNEGLLSSLKRGGELFLSNAMLDGRFALRACICNFRTSLEDVEAVPEIVLRHGRRIHREMR